MRRPLLPVLALAAAVPLASFAAGAPAATAPAVPWLTDLEAARAQAAASDKLLLVDLFAEWCAWCHALEKSVFPDPTFQAFVADRFVLVKVDTEDEGVGSDLKQRFRVGSLPTTLILDPDLVEVGSVPGFHRPADFVTALGEQLAAWKAFQARAAEDERSDDPAVLLALAGELYARGAGARAAEINRRLLPRAGTDGVPPAAELHYRVAESLRRGGDLAGAAAALARADEELSRLPDASAVPGLAERLALLRYHIAHDRGDCSGVRSSLEAFLADYPRSAHADRARRTLASLESEPNRCV
jgi:thiol-disulfide isomerase/thioredoxin